MGGGGLYKKTKERTNIKTIGDDSKDVKTSREREREGKRETERKKSGKDRRRDTYYLKQT